MNRRVAVQHRIEIRRPTPIEFPTHWARLRPAPLGRRRVSAYTLRIEPQPNFLNWVRDPLENHLARIDLPEPISHLSITSEAIVELEPINPFDFFLEPDADKHPFEYSAQLRRELAAYLRWPQGDPHFQQWTASLARKPANVIDRLNEVLKQVGEGITIDSSAAAGPIDIGAVLSSRRASPWALAWLLTLGLRSIGFAARFVSGHVIGAGETRVPVELRAWSDVFLPGAGWVGIDPIAGIFTNETYLTLTSAPEPNLALPLVAESEIAGAKRTELLGGRVLREVEPSRPYSVCQRQSIEELTQDVDATLNKGGLALSIQRDIAMVSGTEPDAPEWTYAALGGDKLVTAERLLWKLRARLAPRSVPVRTQAQWYAGEPLPRWRLMCVFRADRTPLWEQPEIPFHDKDGEELSLDEARSCAEEITRRLEISPSCLVAAYEDPLFKAWHERDVFRHSRLDEDLRTPEGRVRRVQTLSEGRGKPSGYVLPLHRGSSPGWRSGSWTLRRKSLYLSPGDSPMGLRLPLDSLPPAPTTAREADDAETLDHKKTDEVPRTALCFELRDGRLHIFLPPTESFDRYTELIEAIDATLSARNVAASLEGYEPPDDPRLRHLSVEPDIGVLRVSMPETSSCRDHADMLRVVYGECRALDLHAFRESEGGDRTPIGRCAPLTLYGSDARANPLVQRPALLRELIRRWQVHPSLSYFFATRPVGPDGVAARPDEVRMGNAYEVALGLERLTSHDDTGPHRAHRALQHLLTDAKLDARGAELQVDDPSASDEARAARERLIIRSFETPPDATMAALEAVLITALVARVSHDTHPAGTAGDSRFSRDHLLLPQTLWGDLCELLADIEMAGCTVRREWFHPFLDFHFPILGEVQIGDLALELREAHEPQPVLAEEGTPGGPVRFVDVANDRLQLRATGLTPGRHVVTCNGRVVPLQSTGASGEAVCGIRYKTRAPAATLHPTIKPVRELVFDLVDTWNQVRLGGCTYRPASEGLKVRFTKSRATPLEAGGPAPVPLAVREPVVTQLAPTAGRFLPHGSAPDAPIELVAAEGIPYVFDLTR